MTERVQMKGKIIKTKLKIQFYLKNVENSKKTPNKKPTQSIIIQDHQQLQHK
jgi:hypothetical protein